MRQEKEEEKEKEEKQGRGAGRQYNGESFFCWNLLCSQRTRIVNLLFVVNFSSFHSISYTIDLEVVIFRITIS